MSRREIIVDTRGDDHDAEHEHRPIHFLPGRTRPNGKKGHDETDDEEDERDVIDETPNLVQTPAARQ